MEAAASGVFVGRARELGRLARALEAAHAGHGTTVLVAGEAGIGKTRLASELATLARAAGFDVLLGRSIDLVGVELPYQPFVEALRPLGPLTRDGGLAAGSQLAVFEQALALLADRAAGAPVLLVLEDLHWADVSTLDLVVFLAHNLDGRRVLLLASYRADEPASAARMHRLAGGVRRSGSAAVVELGPLPREELTALLAARAGAPAPAALTDAILARSQGNPFFAEELLAATGEQHGALPHDLRDLLLQRVARLDPTTQGLLRLAAAAGPDAGYPLLRAVAPLAEADLRESLRRAIEHRVLVAEQATGTFRFRHALLAEAVYSTILPGEREELHARLAEELAAGGVAAAELASHWAAAGRPAEALAASIEAARQAEAVFGLAEALAHLERALTLWPAVPDAAASARVDDLAELCSWAARLATDTGAAPRAVTLTGQALQLVGAGDPSRAARLHENLGRYLHTSGRSDAALAEFRRAVELVPAHPPSAQRAEALVALARAFNVAWRYEESLAICEEALGLASSLGEHQVEVRALVVLGSDLTYLGRGAEGLAQLWWALRLAEANADPFTLTRAYVALTDALMMLGRLGESARLAKAGLDALHPYGHDVSTLVANRVEALVANGQWDEADRVSGAALRAITANYPHQILATRAELEAGRGDFERARAHLDDAATTVHEDASAANLHTILAELALWERRWTDADETVRAGLARARSRDTAQIRARLGAKGLRALADLAGLARARRDTAAADDIVARARKLLTAARRAAAQASTVTPNGEGWRALAEAEYDRARGDARPERWSDAADTWERLERPPLAAYCRWRQAEAFAAAGARRAEASGPLVSAYATATRIGARPLLEEIELLAQRGRLDLAPRDAAPGGTPGLAESLGLTPREAEVLTLVARGYTNREIAAALVISARTAGVHVSHILSKLGAPNRLEAAAIAHRLAPPR
jgi:DNA-binding CsgD family transcriptional regulator/tetratricopeptide (TPR) repeat protein